MFHDFFAFVLFESDQPIKNITASYQVMFSNPNIVYICFPYWNLGSLGDGGDSHVFCLVHRYVLCSCALSTNNNNKKPPRSRVSFRNMTKHHFCSSASKLPPLQLPMHPELRLSSLSMNYYINTNFSSLSRLYLWQGFESCFVLYYHIRSFPGPNLSTLYLCEYRFIHDKPKHIYLYVSTHKCRVCTKYITFLHLSYKQWIWFNQFSCSEHILWLWYFHRGSFYSELPKLCETISYFFLVCICNIRVP